MIIALVMNLSPVHANESDASSYFNQAHALSKKRKFKQAKKLYTKAIELSPEYTEAYVNRGMIAFELKQNDDAITDFTKALELKPDYAMPHFLRGACFARKKQYKKLSQM